MLISLIVLAAIVGWSVTAVAQTRPPASSRLRFDVSFIPQAHDGPITGRVFVMVTRTVDKVPEPRLQIIAQSRAARARLFQAFYVPHPDIRGELIALGDGTLRVAGARGQRCIGAGDRRFKKRLERALPIAARGHRARL